MTLCLGPRSAPRPGPPRFNHVKCPPQPALAPFVDHYWVSRWDRRGHVAKDASSLLDPCVHLHVENGRASVMGVLRGTYRVRIEGVGCVAGVKFRAGGFYPFVSRSISELTDRVIPSEEVLGETDASWSRALSSEIIECTGDAAEHASIATKHLDAFLCARLPERDSAAEHAARLVALIASCAELRRVSDLVSASGNSERTLHRLFARYVGVSPAWVIRRFRLRAAAERLTTATSVDVSAVASELGYADQAHFIRDFRATIGMTPGAYVQSRA